MLEACDVVARAHARAVRRQPRARSARAITCLEAGVAVDLPAPERDVPVLGITGTGGSGKSSLTDELVNRLRRDQEDKLRVAVIAVDPTRRKGGGALLGDRIRMNSIGVPNVFFRSLATRSSTGEVPEALAGAIDACKAAGFDLVIVETPGIGQGDAGIVPYSDVSLYVMTPEFGAASQLEKIDMLDYADAVAINKFDRRGGPTRSATCGGRWRASGPRCPVFGTIAARFNDDGVTAVYQHLRSALDLPPGTLAPVDTDVSTGSTVIVPPARERYLAEVAETVRRYHAETDGAGRGRAAPPAPAHREGGARGRRRRRTSRPAIRCSTSGPARSTRSPAEVRDVAVGHAGAESGDPSLRGRRRAAPLRPQREPSRPVPVHRRGLPVEARGRGSGADVRGRGRSGADQPSVPPARRRASRRRVSRPRSTR